MARVVASAAQTATGQSSAIPAGDVVEFAMEVPPNSIGLLVDCTAVSGISPTLDLTIEWSHNGTDWATVDGTADSFAQITAAKKTVKVFPIKAPQYRVKWTIGGTTPSFTFSVDEHPTK